MKKKIMVFCDFYLPGYKSGGGMWSVVNLVDHFKADFDFFIVTRNHDGKGDKQPYESVITGDWNDVRNAKVFYFGKEGLSPARSASLLAAVSPDVVFLNSALSIPAVSFLRARRKGRIGDIPVILASCGEMAPVALSVKPLKKKAFLAYAKMTGLYDGVIWKATTEAERDEIRTIIGDNVEVMVAADLTPAAILPDYDPEWKPPKQKGNVRFATLTRLIPTKNVHYFLERLRDVPAGEIIVDIIGPAEERPYVQQLERIIAELPENIEVQFAGPLPNRDALRRLCESHFFVSTTMNENFGYVFVEAMAAGCPLLISDRNIWADLDQRNVGWRIPLEQPERFVESINACVEMGRDEYTAMSAASRTYAVELLEDPATKEATGRVLQAAFSRTKTPN